MGYEGTKFVVYQTIIVLGDGDNFYLMTDDKDEAVEAGREWLAEECGGTEEDYAAVATLPIRSSTTTTWRSAMSRQASRCSAKTGSSRWPGTEDTRSRLGSMALTL